MSNLSKTHVAASLTALLAACGGTKAAPPAPPPPGVLIATVARRDLPLYIEAVGSLDGYVNADMRARVRGYLRSQDFKDGSFVKEGQLLYTIEATDYLAAVAAAKANLERAKVAQSHAKVQVARDENLLKTGMVAQQEVDNQAAIEGDADGQVALAEAQLKQAQLNLSYTQIHSPISGIAGISLVREGNLVGQDGPTLLTTVSQTNPMRVNFAISEVDYVKMQARFAHLEARDLAWAKKQLARLDAGGLADGGDPGLELILADGSTYAHKGIIVTANRQIDSTTGTLSMQALVANPDGILRPGQFGRVRIQQQGEGHDVLAVPEKALINVQGIYSLAVVGADNKVSLKGVELGPAAQGLRIVTKGIREGDKIVVEGTQKVSDGALVNPKPAPETQPVAIQQGK